MPRNSILLSFVGLLVLAAQGVRAQGNAGAGAPPPAVDPKAVAIMKAACDTLSAAPTMSFTAVDTYERAARNGQPLYYLVKSDVTLQRPDKLRVMKIGDGIPDEFYYDGKQVMAYVPSQNVVAVADAPPNIDDMLDAAWNFAEISYPFTDVLVSKPCDLLNGGDLKSAFYVGQSKVAGGVTTDIIALALDDVRGELWIGADDHLPRMIRTDYPYEPAHSRYETEFSNWRLGDPVDPSTFSSAKAAAANRIAFQPPSAAEGPAREPLVVRKSLATKRGTP